MFLPLIVTVALAGDFLATSDDMAKAPCVIHLVQPEGCATDPSCVRIENKRTEFAVVPIIAGVCKAGTMITIDGAKVTQVIIDPKSTRGNLRAIPVLAPKGSGAPSMGWTYLPATVVDVSAVAYSGSWTEAIPFEIHPGLWVSVLDDDATLDIGDHMRVGVCKKQTGVMLGRNKTIEFSSSCTANELAKSNRR